MIRTQLAAAVILLASMLCAQEQSAIGEWRDHFPYTDLISVAQGGGYTYAASSTALFRYHQPTGEIVRLNKTNVLSDVGIQGLAWNEPIGALLIHYTNGNLDLLRDDQGYNIGDIKRSSILGNKGVYCATMSGTTAYLGTGFGIVVLDLEAREIRQTWFIGPNGSQVRVNGIALTADSIYAAANTGLFTASRTAPNLASFDSWRKRTDMGAALASGPFNTIAVIGDNLLLNAQRPGNGGDSLLVLGPSNSWTRFEPLFGLTNRSMSLSMDGQSLVVTHQGSLHQYGPQLNETSYLSEVNGSYLEPTQAIQAAGSMWISDRKLGLVRVSQGAAQFIVPDGPRTAASWRLASSQGSLYVATGAVTGTWDNTFMKDGVHTFRNGDWSTIDRTQYPLMNGVNEYAGAANDIIAVAVDPEDEAHAFVGSWDEGLIELRNGAPVTIYNPNNSALGYEANPYQGRLYVSGLAYDEDGTLWMANAWSERPIVARTKEGNWYSFDPGTTTNGNHLVSDIVAAKNGYKWLVRPRGNGLLVYDSGSSLESTDDDRYKALNNQTGNGGLPSPDIFAVAEDKEQQIWVGTSRGVAVFYAPDAVFTGEDFDAQQILIEQDGNVQVLLETEVVSTLVVDGANRKWIGTQTSGVFLVSADGREQLLHFTAENSPLPSNTVTNIAIDGSTGEVFMATDRGIMSYRGDATEGALESECVSVFPNPVRETYTGPIAVTGLVRNSEVKITDVSGNLVYRTSSQGGQAIWNGNDMSGRRASTGVYLIFASDPSGTFKCNTKVLLVR